MNIVFPAAGEGRRFREAGYTFPKPLIEVNGKPMIQVAYECLGHLPYESKTHFIVRQEDADKYSFAPIFDRLSPNWTMTLLSKPTEGAACTVLKVKNEINNDEPLLIVNSDQIVKWDTHNAMSWFEIADGGIVCFNSTHPKWSYVDWRDGKVQQVAEKRVISDLATVGIYYWGKGSDFVKYAEKMIEVNDRTNGEFYVAPVFNHAINDGKRFLIYKCSKMHGLGDPESLERYLQING